MAILYSTDFDSTTAGQLPAGWANAVGTWIVSATNAPNVQGLRANSTSALDAVIYTGQSMTDGSLTLDHKAIVASGNTNSATTGIFRATTSYSNGYLLNWDNAGRVSFFKRVSGSYSQIGSTTTVILPAFDAGDILRQEIRFVGSAFEWRLWNVTKGGARPGAAMWSATDGTFTSGYAGILNNIDPGDAARTPTADNFQIADAAAGAAATSYTLSGPGTGTVGTASGAFTVTMNGVLSQDATFTPSDGGSGGSFAPSTLTIPAGATTGTFSYTPASSGSKSVSTTNNRSLANPSAVSMSVGSTAVTIARTNAALRWSPGNWADDGTSRMSANTGAYVRFGFTGTSLTLLTTALASMPAFPQLRAIIDGVAYDVGLSTATVFTIASGLPDTSHTCELYMRASLWSAASWWNLANALKITGLRLDGGAGVSAPAARSKVMLSFGDSLTQGYFVDGTTSPANDDALATYSVAIAEAMDAEYGQIGWGGTNYAGAGVSDVPAFNTSYASVANGYSRLASGQFVTQPDYVTVMLGTNGVAAQADVATGISNLRAAAPAAWIFVIVPGSGQSRAGITAAANAAITAGDTKVVLVDAGTRYQTGLASVSGSATEAATDAVHYRRRTNARLAVAWVRQIQHAIEPRRFTVVAA